jgi:hypothetical protein
MKEDAQLIHAMEFPILHRPESNSTALFHKVVVRAKLSKFLDIRPPFAAGTRRIWYCSERRRCDEINSLGSNYNDKIL